MGIRTVRLDDEAEKTLREIQAETNMPISTALKRGLRAVRDEVVAAGRRTAWDVYSRLDLGPGGYAKGPSTATRATVTRILRRRRKR